jgi:hypothetical protein
VPGLQLINVAFGGALYQDIETQHPGALQHRNATTYDQHFHDIQIVPDSRLAQLYPNTAARPRQQHPPPGHQARGARLCGRGLSEPDGVPEAIRLKPAPGRGYIAATQWHPEFHKGARTRWTTLPSSTTFWRPQQLANGVVDAFVHTVEQYLTYPVNALVQDRFAEGILHTLIEVGPRLLTATEPVYDDRANLMWAATMALNGLIGAGVPQDWATHMIGHELTALHGIDHARTLAIVLPALLNERRGPSAPSCCSTPSACGASPPAVKTNASPPPSNAPAISLRAWASAPACRATAWAPR